MVNRDYFKEAITWNGDAGYPPAFEKMPQLAGFEAAPGVVLRPFWGERLMASYVTFAAHAEAPLHQHDQEQLSFVISGTLTFTVGHESREMGAGDIVSVPPGVPHAAKAGPSGAVAIDMFSPPREGFRELMAASQGVSPS
ncbi:MAG: cupin domain-containing protein [Firmicutes bacterium]|nr:cupin domain-containing protein [Bacillota bacterium]